MNDEHYFNKSDIDGSLKKHSKKAKELANDHNKLEDFTNNVLDKLQNIPAIGDIIEDVRLLVNMVQDYAKGNYKDIPLASIITAIAALVYFVSPIDLIPDYIPVIGYIDDAAVVAFALNAIHNDIQSYKDWTESADQNE